MNSPLAKTDSKCRQLVLDQKYTYKLFKLKAFWVPSLKMVSSNKQSSAKFSWVEPGWKLILGTS